MQHCRWPEQVLHRPAVAEMLDADPAVDLEDCRLISLTTSGSRYEHCWDGTGPRLWSHEGFTLEVATPADASASRVATFTAVGVTALQVVGCLDRRRGRLRLDPDLSYITLAPAEPRPVLVRFSAPECRLRARAEVVELDHVRSELHPRSVAPPVASRVRVEADDQVVVDHCAVADVSAPLALALARRSHRSRREGLGLILDLCGTFSLEHGYDGTADEDWVIVSCSTGGVLEPVAMVHLLTPLALFFDERLHRRARGVRDLLTGVVSVVVPSYREAVMCADPDVLSTFHRTTRRHPVSFDDELFSAEDLWFEGT